MRRLLVTVVAGCIMALFLLVAAPAAHADPAGCMTPDQAAAALTQLQNGIVDPNAANQAPNCGVTGSLAPNPGPVVAQVYDFVKSPLAYIGAAVMGAATFVLAQVASLANASTAPDLSLDFWKSAYAQAWAIGLVLFCGVLLWEFGNLALRRVTPAQFMATLGIWAPAALGAMLFGPMIAQTLIQGSTYLADGLIKHMVGFGGSDSFNAIDKSIQNTSIFGGGTQGPVQGFLAIFFGLAMLIAVVLVYLSLAFQALIMYLSAAAFAIAAAWMASTHTRKHTFSYARMFITMCFAKVIVIFCLGVTLAMATAATAITGDGVSRDFALIVMAIIGMFVAAFAPMLLGKHAPVLPGMAAPVGVGMAIAGSAVGWTAGSAAARGVGRAARAGGSKLGAVASRKGAATPPPGSSSGPGRIVDAPVPPAQSGTSKAGARSAAAGRVVDPPIPGSGAATRGGSGSTARAAASSSRRPTGQHRAPDSQRAPRGRQPETSAAKPTVTAERSAGRQPDAPSKLNQATRKPPPPEKGNTT